jgi:hypothetical protein
VMNSDVATSATHYLKLNTKNTNVYANGQINTYDGATWSGTTHDLNFIIAVERNSTSVTMPSGYDQKAKIGWVYNDGSSNFVPFIAMDRSITPLTSRLLASGVAVAIPTSVNLAPYLPPVSTKSWWFLSLTTATGTRTVSMAPAETGYAATVTPRTGGAAVHISASVSGAEVGPIINSSNWGLTFTTGDAYSIYAGPWEW